MKRQQAFIASMASTVLSSDTLARPDRLLAFLEAATESLTLDEGLGNLVRIAQLGYEFRGIGADKVQFMTIPNTADPSDPNKLVWTEDAAGIWNALAEDEPLPKKLRSDVISAGKVPGSSSGDDSGDSSGSGGGKGLASDEALEAAGLCT